MTNIHSGALWGHFGVTLGDFWDMLASFWIHFGTLWRHFVSTLSNYMRSTLETFWPAFRKYSFSEWILIILWNPDANLEPLGVHFGALWVHFGFTLAQVGRSWRQFGPKLAQFGPKLGPQRAPKQIIAISPTNFACQEVPTTPTQRKGERAGPPGRG